MQKTSYYFTFGTLAVVKTRVPHRKAVSVGGNPLWTHTLSLSALQLSSSREFSVLLVPFSADPVDRSSHKPWAV